MKKVLLTGATGFIGSACLKLLQQKTSFETHCFYRTNQANIKTTDGIHWHYCDILDNVQVKKTIEMIQPDYLIHLAWYVEHKLFWSSEKNIPYIAATINLYKEFSLNGGKKATFLGTCAEYAPEHSRCDEEATPLLPNTLYGVAKKSTFELLNQLKKDNSDYAPFSWVRLFNVFGPHENRARLIPYIFENYLQNKAPILNNPFAIRDHLYVENLAHILLELLRSDAVGALNVGQQNSYSILELAQIIHERYFSHLPEPICSNTSSDIIHKEERFIPDLEKFKSLHISLPYSLEEGLDKSLNWWKGCQLSLA